MHLQEIERRQYYRFEGVEDLEEWSVKCKVRQARKYRRIGRELTPEDVAGHRVGVEGMDQVALAPAGLRALVWRLAEEEELSAGALSVGRQAAEPLWAQGRAEEALRVLEARALQAADKEEAKRKEQRARSLTPVGRIEGALERAQQQLDKVLKAGEPLTGGQVRSLRLRIAGLVGLDRALAELEASAAAAPARQSETAAVREEVAAAVEPEEIADRGASHSAIADRGASHSAIANRGASHSAIADRGASHSAIAVAVPAAPAALVRWLRALPEERGSRLEAASFAAEAKERALRLRAELERLRDEPPSCGAPPEEAWAWLGALAAEAGAEAALRRALGLFTAAGLPSLGLRLQLLSRQPLSVELRGELPALRAQWQAARAGSSG